MPICVHSFNSALSLHLWKCLFSSQVLFVNSSCLVVIATKLFHHMTKKLIVIIIPRYESETLNGRELIIVDNVILHVDVYGFSHYRNCVGR